MKPEDDGWAGLGGPPGRREGAREQGEWKHDGGARANCQCTFS